MVGSENSCSAAIALALLESMLSSTPNQPGSLGLLAGHGGGPVPDSPAIQISEAKKLLARTQALLIQNLKDYHLVHQGRIQ